MTIKLSALKKHRSIEKVTIHSLDSCVYQVSVIIDGKEEYVADDKGKLLRSFDILSFQHLFEPFDVGSMVVRHQSAYDEMIGQPSKQGSNAIEVPVGNGHLAAGNPEFKVH